MRHAIVAGLLALLALPVFGQTATLTCTAPTQYTNGQPIGTAVISYRFFRGASQTGPFTLETRTSTTCGTTYTNLAVGTHWFTASATVNGVESVQTAPVSKVVPPPQPQPPTNLTVDVTLVGSSGWTCNDPSGVAPSSNHVRQDQAQERCTNLAVANVGKAFEMRPGGVYRIVASARP